MCRSLDQFGYGPGLLNSDQPGPTATNGPGPHSLRANVPDGSLRHLLENWQWLQRPGRTLKTQDPRSSSSPLRGDPGKHLLHRGFDKPLDSALASAEHHS